MLPIQIRDPAQRGIQQIASLCESLMSSEESVLCRCVRTVANAANEDHKNAVLLHAEGISATLVRCLNHVASAKTKQVIVRAVRVLSNSPEHKRLFREARAIVSLALLLSTADEDLLKAAAKCLAHFTHGCDAEVASQVRGEDGRGLDRLLALMRHGKRSVWEAAMATVVNLSHLDRFRPTLGNAGAVVALIAALEERDGLTPKEVAHAVTALCLYCRESVNRMKLREHGGLRLFIKLLNDASKESLHDRIVNSLLQFAYDDLGLKVLQHYGIIPCLVSFVVRYTERHRLAHDCAEEICEMIDDVEEEGGGVNDGEKEAEPGEDQEDATAEDVDDKEAQEDEPVEVAENVQDYDSSSQAEPQEQQQPPDRDQLRPSTSRTFRVNSPSYQAVQHDFEEFERIRNEASASAAASPNTSGFVWRDSPAPAALSPCVSPDRNPFSWPSSPGYSPSPSSVGSHRSSPDRYDSDAFLSGGPLLPSYSPSNQEVDSPPISPDDENIGYSPVERFSDDESSDTSTASKPPCTPGAAGGAASATTTQSQSHPIPSTSQSHSQPPASTTLPPEEPPPSKKPRALSYKSIFSPTYEPTFATACTLHSPPPAPQQQSPSAPSSSFFSPLPKPGNREATETAGDSAEGRKENSRIGWALQILSRLSQVEKPHEDLMALETVQALVGYLAHTRKPLPRAARILTRLSKNLHCVMTFALQRHMSWVTRAVDHGRPTLADSPCQSCANLIRLRASVSQNISLLAETGYAEGQICWHLLRGHTKAERQSVAISAPMLVRPRKLLRNILLTHGGMEVLLEVLELCHDSGGAADDEELFTDAVLSIHTLSCHVGVVAPNLKLEEKSTGECCFDESAEDDDLTFTLDDGSTFAANRARLASGGCDVFEAMLGGGFAESTQSTVRMPETRRSVLRLLCHYLYGCRWCPAFAGVDMDALLELVLAADKYLLPEFNASASQEVVQRFLRCEEVVAIYEKSLQRPYPVSGVEETLSRCAVNYLLVGSSIGHARRVQIFRQLVSSKMAVDFVDDINKTIREKLLEI